MAISAESRAVVRRRANDACEYCRLPAAASYLPHQIDHIIAAQHGGSDDISNLCLCCIACNLKKGPNVSSIDAIDDDSIIVRLFDPRTQLWDDHFQLLVSGEIAGISPAGRATARLLDFNAQERVELRLAVMRHTPQ